MYILIQIVNNNASSDASRDKCYDSWQKRVVTKTLNIKPDIEFSVTLSMARYGHALLKSTTEVKLGHRAMFTISNTFSEIITYELTLKVKVKNADDLDQKWLANVSCQQVYVCKNLRFHVLRFVHGTLSYIS